MFYKCLECGHIFEDGEEGNYFETQEIWGRDFREKIKCCPLCKGDYEATVPCEICGSYHLKDELTNGVCEECIEEQKFNLRFCYEASKGEEVYININSFLASMIDKDEMEEILFKALLNDESMGEKIDCSKFINEDKYWFAEKLVKGVKK